MPSTGSRTDPYRGYNFAVEVEGLVAGGFSEVSGLQVEVEVEEYREGGVNGFIHKRAGPARYSSNVVLKRGMTDNKVLWNWYWDVVQGKIERVDPDEPLSMEVALRGREEVTRRRAGQRAGRDQERRRHPGRRVRPTREQHRLGERQPRTGGGEHRHDAELVGRQ